MPSAAEGWPATAVCAAAVVATVMTAMAMRNARNQEERRMEASRRSLEQEAFRTDTCRIAGNSSLSIAVTADRQPGCGKAGGAAETRAPRTPRPRGTEVARDDQMHTALEKVILYLINMKAIQITIDESLLRQLDADDEVKAVGRSAVLRRAVEAYLKMKRAADVDAAYRRAYRQDGLGADWKGWPEEGAWPEE
jgi:hypothetical protein